MKKEYIIPIFVPNLGCPNCCVFCNQRKISGEQRQVTSEDVKNTIEYYLQNFRDDNKYVEVAFFGGSFTGIEESVQNNLLEAVQSYIDEGKVNSIRISTRPDYIDKDVRIASKLIRKYGFILGHQMMVGLPESTALDEVTTAKNLIKLKPKIVRIYPVLVIKNTELEDMYKKGEYTPLSINQAVERCKEVVKLFNDKNIEVIRIGLQNTEEITDPSIESSQVVTGPYHPAFRQLVESSMWYDTIVSDIKKINTKVVKIKILANPTNINNIIGHKKDNVIKLKETYDLDVVVEEKEDIKPGKFEIEILKTYEDLLSEDHDFLGKTKKTNTK